MTAIDHRRLQTAAHAAHVATFEGPVVSFDVRQPYYLASCDACGWVGSSEKCGSTCDDDVICPRCFTWGADCGRVAAMLGASAELAADSIKADIIEADAAAWMLRARRRDQPDSAGKLVCGQVFMKASTAAEAAKRHSNRWRIAEAVPLFERERTTNG